MGTSSPYYKPQMKLFDMISSDHDLLHILERLGIKLGFGDNTNAEVCHKYDLSIDLFLMICNIYSFEEYQPNIDILRQNDIPRIISYLQASHRYYIEKFFPQLHELIHTMVTDLDEVNRNVLNRFYDNYDTEVINHFAYEEQQVFPYVESLLGNRKDCQSEYHIGKFEENHSNIEEKLNDLKSIIIKYIPEESTTDNSYSVVDHIFKIERDLKKHSLIENKLLIPLVSKFEQNE